MTGDLVGGGRRFLSHGLWRYTFHCTDTHRLEGAGRAARCWVPQLLQPLFQVFSKFEDSLIFFRQLQTPEKENPMATTWSFYVTRIHNTDHAQIH